MGKIAITTTSFCEYDQYPLKNLKDKGFEYIFNPYGRKLKKDELMDLAKDAVGIIAGTESIDADVIKKLAVLKVISRCGAGIDNVDLVAAEKQGIKVYNTPDAPTLAVAELTIGMMLDMMRKVSQMDRLVRSGQWKKLMGNLLYEKKIGIIGYGRIGKKVASLLRSFNCDICYADPVVEEDSSGMQRLALKDLLKWADIVSIHVSSSNKIIGAPEIACMKRGAWIVNVSRGGVIDEKCLYENLRNGYLAGAAIDVYEREPYEGVLRDLDNIILTPHVGSYARESRIEMEAQSVANLLAGLLS
jgi:D-3-phosphoglycerate dehydrogenase